MAKEKRAPQVQWSLRIGLAILALVGAATEGACAAVVVWGDNNSGETNVPPAVTNIIGIAAGALHCLGLRQDGTVVAWGYDGFGQTNVPAGLSNVVAIAGGSSHSLALMGDGTVVGWGDNTYGEATPPGGLTNVVAVAGGGLHSLALTGDGRIVGWGDNTYGQATSPPGLSNVVAISAGDAHSLALRSDGTVVGWGFNTSGQASPPPGLSDCVGIEAGSVHSLALKSDGTVTNWAYGQAPPAGLSNVVGIAGGEGFGLALRSFGTVVGWGNNGSGQTTPPAGLSNAVAVDAGNSHSIALTVDATTQVRPRVWWDPITSRTISADETLILNPLVLGSRPFKFQWFFNGTAMSEQTNNWLVLRGTQLGESGGFQLVITNNYGAVTSQFATVVVPATISVNPSSQAIPAGSNVTFTVSAFGTALGYQWFHSGAPLSDSPHAGGSRSQSLTIFDVQFTDAGDYWAVATNTFSAATSLKATLTSLTGPSSSVRFVDLNNLNPLSPYLSWGTAATNIQDALDAAVTGDKVIVTNGIYSYGGRVISGQQTNRVIMAKAVELLSVNGAGSTAIVGATATRCAYVGNGARLNGFTLRDGRTATSGSDRSGGGVWCETGGIISNCVLIGNIANNSGGGIFGGAVFDCTVATNQSASGGGAASAALYRSRVISNYASTGGGVHGCAVIGCVLTNNRAGGGQGGGAYASALSNCVVVGNWAYDDGGGVSGGTNYNCIIRSNSTFYGTGGGAYSSTMHNCALIGNGGGARNSVLYSCTVVSNYSSSASSAAIYGGKIYNSISYFNTGPGTPNWYPGAIFTNCCTTPLPAGPGNFTNAPRFVNSAAQNFRLQTNSPCINFGNNAFVGAATDLDGRSRIVGGTVDLGAYEFQGPDVGEFIAWLQQYALPTDGSADFTDADGDRASNWQEWRAGTNPTNALSLFQLFTPWRDSLGITVSWFSVTGKTYYLQRSTNLAAPQAGLLTIRSNIAGQTGITSHKDTTATNADAFLYRVGLQ